MSDLAVCRMMHWTYEDVLRLPVEVYDVLIEELSKQAEQD